MSTDRELERIREALALRPKGPGRRIPQALRRRIARYTRRRVHEGAARATAAKELGVCDQTVVNALKSTPEDLLPVRVAEVDDRLTVRGPAGLTIEGLDIERLATLIRALL